MPSWTMDIPIRYNRALYLRMICSNKFFSPASMRVMTSSSESWVISISGNYFQHMIRGNADVQKLQNNEGFFVTFSLGSALLAKHFQPKTDL